MISQRPVDSVLICCAETYFCSVEICLHGAYRCRLSSPCGVGTQCTRLTLNALADSIRFAGWYRKKPLNATGARFRVACNKATSIGT